MSVEFSEFDSVDNQQGCGDQNTYSAHEVDDSLNLLGDDQTLRHFMNRENELTAAHSQEESVTIKAQIALQLTQLQNAYPDFRLASIEERHSIRQRRIARAAINN